MYIKEYRKKAKFTLKKLGALVGVSESAMSLYESGKRRPDYETLLKISEALDCCVDELLRGPCTKNNSFFTGKNLLEDDIKYRSAVAYTLRKLKELTTLKAAQNLNRLVELYDGLDDIDKGKIIERMEVMHEAV